MSENAQNIRGNLDKKLRLFVCLFDWRRFARFKDENVCCISVESFCVLILLKMNIGFGLSAIKVYNLMFKSQFCYLSMD